MNIGFIGFGEAAYYIALGLSQNGIIGIRASDIMQNHPAMGQQIRDRANEAQVKLIKDQKEVARWADVLFAAVPSSFTMDVCDTVRDELRPGQIYVDVSASSPAMKTAIWARIKDTGVLFADAAMLGSLPQDRHQVPISASGNGAGTFKELMEPLGMRITVVGDKAGSASAIKLVRSIFMKGIASLMIETMQAADAYGVSEEIISSLGKSLDGISFIKHLDRLVTGSALHCRRRAVELDGSIAMLEEKGIMSDMTVATKHRLEALEPYGFAEKYASTKPQGYAEIIETIRPE